MSEAQAGGLMNQIETLIRYVQDAARDCENGRAVKMTDLASKTAVICETVQKAPPELAHRMKPFMAELIQELDMLEMKLKDRKPE